MSTKRSSGGQAGSDDTKLQELLEERAQLHVESEKADVAKQQARQKLAENLLKIRQAGFTDASVACW